MAGYLKPVWQETRFVSYWYEFLSEPALKFFSQEDGQFLGFFFLGLVIAELLRLACRAIDKKWDHLDRLSFGCLFFAVILIIISFGPNFTIFNFSPYKVIYRVYLSFTGFFRAPARMAFLSHWLMVVSVGILSSKLLWNCKQHARVLVAFSFGTICYLESAPSQQNPNGIYTPLEIIGEIDKHDPSGTEAYVALDYNMYLYTALTPGVKWRPTMNGFVTAALGRNFDKMIFHMQDFPTTHTVGYLATHNIPWIITSLPQFQDKLNDDPRFTFVASKQLFNLYRLNDIPTLKAEYTELLRQRAITLNSLSAGIPPVIRWPENLAFRPVSGTNIHNDSNSVTISNAEANHVSAFFAPASDFTPGTIGSIIVSYETSNPQDNHASVLYWASKESDITERRKVEGITKRVDDYHFTTTFNVGGDNTWMIDDSLRQLRFDFFEFDNFPTGQVKIMDIKFKKQSTLDTVPPL